MFSFEAKRAFFFEIKKFLAKPLLTSITSPIDPTFLTFSKRITSISQKKQRELSLSIKRARNLALL